MMNSVELDLSSYSSNLRHHAFGCDNNGGSVPAFLLVLKLLIKTLKNGESMKILAYRYEGYRLCRGRHIINTGMRFCWTA